MQKILIKITINSLLNFVLGQLSILMVKLIDMHKYRTCPIHDWSWLKWWFSLVMDLNENSNFLLVRNKRGESLSRGSSKAKFRPYRRENILFIHRGLLNTPIYRISYSSICFWIPLTRPIKSEDAPFKVGLTRVQIVIFT